MKPETMIYIDAAERDLAEAKGILSLKYWRQASRLAYYARFHAAQALIFERTGKISKTHKGVHTLFHRLAQAELAIPPGAGVELVKAYSHKEIADYDFGTSPNVTSSQASNAIADAVRFVAAVRQALTAQ